MSKESPTVPLVVRFRGPGVQAGRILLADLVQFGRQLQTAVDRVALVLSGEASSTQRGRRPEHIRSACALEVVALNRGSFEMALDLRRDQLPLAGMDTGPAVLEKLIGGLSAVAGEQEALPSGYDAGVLAAWREAARLLDHGLETIDLSFRSGSTALEVSYDRRVHERIVARIQAPVRNLRTIEGRLMMADFKDSGRRCRVHPPLGSPVEIEFPEALENAVYDHLRSFVRVTGEAEQHAQTGRIRVLRLRDIEEITLDATSSGSAAEDFWREPSLEELAVEQGICQPQKLDDLVGAGADLWDGDEQFDEFLAGIYARRREGGEAEESRR